jgi:uncharacterized OsmC-like protein
MRSRALTAATIVPPSSAALEGAVNLRELQEPLRDRYRREPGSAGIVLRADASLADTPLACSVDIGRAVYDAQAHGGVGGAGTGACSGDLLLGALAACAQITCQMVAESMGLRGARIEVSASGELDLRGTLGMDREVPVGFRSIRTDFRVEAPEASSDELAALARKTERYCVVMQTLAAPPALETGWRFG